jgi:PAS domain S-box-containing protein
MNQTLRILHLEDNSSDAELVKRFLKKEEIDFEIRVTENKCDFTKALGEFCPDVILADHRLPAFDSEQALEISFQHNYKTPFILLTGNVSEEFAAGMIKKGAHDYVLKSNMQRLPNAILRAVEFSRFEEERQKFLQDVIASEGLLREAERLAHLGSWQIDLTTQETKWSDEAYRILGLDPGETELTYERFLEFVHPADHATAKEMFAPDMLSQNDEIKSNIRIIDKFNNLKYIRSALKVVKDHTGIPVKIIGFNLDVTETVKAEQEVKKRESFYKKLIERSSDMKILFSSDGMILYGSPSIKKILGYHPGEYLGINGLKMIHKNDFRKLVTRMKNLIPNDGGAFYNQQRIRHKNGSYRWCAGTISNHLNDPDINAFVANFRDVTARKESEDKLIQSQSHLLASQRIGNVGSWELTLKRSDTFDYGKTFWSEQTYRIFGYEPDEVEVSSEFFIERVHPDDRERIRISTREAIRSSRFYSSEHRILRKDGQTRIVQNNAEVIRDPITLKAIKMIGVVQDITEIKSAQMALAKSEANLSSIVHNTELAYVLLDNDLTIRFYNEPANAGFLREAGKQLMLGSNVLDYFTGDRRNRLIDTCKKVLAGGKVNYETSFTSENGVILWYDNLNTPVKDSDGQILGMILSRTDITERKLLELERENITEDLIQRNKDLEQFAYITSHNLRGPVANILGSVNILQEEDLGKTEKKVFLSVLKQSVDKLDTVIIDLNHILEIRNAVNEKKENVILSGLIVDIQSGIQQTIENEQVKFVLNFSECNRVLSIKSYLHSIFYNLITNSIKFRKPDIAPQIEISSQVHPGILRIIYRDNGLGLNSEKLKSQVFGLYKRFHFHTEGKGMGLFMVKTQVETLGGRIKLNSEENMGCEFILDFKI